MDLPADFDGADLLSAVAAAFPIKGFHRTNQVGIIAEFGAMLPAMGRRLAITTPLRLAHFLAQLAHESDGFCTAEEYAPGDAYEGRADLGNTEAGDGRRYKGRGLIQLTGRVNYRAFTRWMRDLDPICPDYEAAPERVRAFPAAGYSAGFFWATHKLNVLADQDDVVAITRRINGGTNGLVRRRTYLACAKDAVAELGASQVEFTPYHQTLHRGADGDDVYTLQRALMLAGQQVALDADFGPATERAVRAFQSSHGLTPDGIVGAQSWAMLDPYIERIDK